MKVAMTGASGTGKTTLVKFVAKELGLKHISGSAGDIKTKEDKDFLKRVFGHEPHQGHYDVIRRSANDFNFGYALQNINQSRREEIIYMNNHFITDRSPVDNLTYFIAQIGFHPELTDIKIKVFAEKCLRAWNQLTHVVHIKPAIPSDKLVENNGSRIANKWYQQASDAQFEYWLKNYFIPNAASSGPKVMQIDYWDLESRQKNVIKFLNS